MKKKRFFLLTLAFLVFGGAFIFYEAFFVYQGSNQREQRQSQSESKTKVAPVQDAIAPNFTLPDLSGREMELAAVYQRNNLTVVNFWATWCGPCRGEIPEFNRFYQIYKARGVEIVAVNLQEKASLVTDFAEEYRMRFPVLLDVQGEVAKDYYITAIPSTFILDGQGKILLAHRGMMDFEQLEVVAEEYL